MSACCTTFVLLLIQILISCLTKTFAKLLHQIDLLSNALISLFAGLHFFWQYVDTMKIVFGYLIIGMMQI